MAHIKSINKVTLIGRVGQDPDLRYTRNGIPVCNLSVATSRSFKKKDSEDWEEVTQWHRIVLWRGLAEFAAGHLSKGSAVYIEGELRYRRWQDDDGNNHTVAEIYATTCNWLQDGRSTSDETGEETLDNDDEIPF